MSKKTKRIKIESNFKKLENIVKKFEKGKLGIEEGISEYEKAAKLIQAIKEELTSIETQIEEIKESY